MNGADHCAKSSNHVLAGVGVLFALYVVALIFDLPQRATAAMAAQQQAVSASSTETTAATTPRHAEVEIYASPPLWTVLPFALILGVIALFPLLPGASHWWDNNLNRFYVAAVLGAVTLAYYLWIHNQPIDAHWPIDHIAAPAESGPSYALASGVFANAIFKEYVPFIVLLFSLYVISGGIRITSDLPAHPFTNSMFLAVGGLLASFIGTTGAAMLLIRPLLETNSERKHVVHTVVFFIFVVCNCGGCLLPLGDPPLFLGYLLGVPFLYTLALWKEWLFVNGLLIAIYYLWDRFWFYPHESMADIAIDEKQVRPVKVSGIWPNALLLLGVVLALAFLDPGKTIPGTLWHPWLYLREIAQLLLVAFSLALGSNALRKDNKFNYAAIVEVAVLFFGIFITMQPALQILAAGGPSLGLNDPAHYFWATGGLSSILDNAPTYVVFFTAAQSLTAKLGLHQSVAGVSQPLLAAISLGSVFMGANTYIGNGPNFMVKAIAEKSGVKMPGFFGYMLYSVAILIPIFILTTFLFF